jgi:flagellar motor switch protein FliN/FliY
MFAKDGDVMQEDLPPPVSVSPQTVAVLTPRRGDAASALPVFRELPPQSRPDLENLRDVELAVKIELGRTRMRIEDVLKLGDGAVVELDRSAGDPVDVFVSDRLVARGEVVVLNDRFAVRLTQVVTPLIDGQQG